METRDAAGTCELLMRELSGDLCCAAGGTALHAAVDGQALETMRELLDVGSDVNLPDRGSLWTPLLRCAATHGNADVARLLLKKGANVNQKDRDGKVLDALPVAPHTRRRSCSSWL